MASSQIRSPVENIALARNHIEAICHYLVPVPPDDDGEHYLARLAFYGLMNRIVELGEASATALLADQLAAGALLSRATGETTAVIYMLASKAKSLATEEERRELDAIARRVVSASRNRAKDLTPAPNILTLIDKLNKEVQNFRALYDVLSEYAHPNAAGIFAAVGPGCTGLDGRVEQFTASSRSLALSSSALFLRVSAAKAFTLTKFSDLPVMHFRTPGRGEVES